MRIVFTSIFRPGTGGGAGRVGHELAQAFAKEHQTVIICPAEKTGYYQDENGLIVYGIRSAGGSEFQMPNLTAKTVRELFDFLDDFQPDIVHAHEPALVGLIGQVWARMNRVPFVHTSHVLPTKAIDFGTLDTINLPLLKSSISDYAVHSILFNFYHNCDALIALNHSALDSIREFGYTGPVFVIPNGRPLERYQSCRFADNNSQQKVLVFTGFISDRKNQAYLLKTLKSLPGNYLLRLIGKPLNPEYLDKLRNYCDKHDLQNVEWIGQIEQDEIPHYLEGAHVFPSASKMEVQSLVVIEALASGTPVVGLSNETIDELIDEDVGAWLAKDQKPAEFARQIERICGLPNDQYQRMCQNARDRVAHLDWSNIVRLTVDAYQQILKNTPALTTEHSEKLSGLVDFLSLGDVRIFLLEVIESTRKRTLDSSKSLPRLKLPAAERPWMRVPTSTWMISGLTVVVSVIGYLFMRGQGKKQP
jgi:1,2-diacylglycerol 3-alpha-glucosyltransferase